MAGLIKEQEIKNFQTKELSDVFARAKHNPDLVVGKAIEMVAEKTNGEISWVDPSNPVAFLAEFASTLASNAIDETNSRMRELYPKLAVRPDELYHHMSSHQYVGRFAVPSTGKIILTFKRDELLALAVPTPDSGVSKLIIPRGTIFSFDNVRFTLLYPVEIRVLPHGAFQVIYDTEKEDPIQILESNIVKWWFQSDMEGNSEIIEVVGLELDVKQVETQYLRGDISSVIDGYVKRIRLDNQFVHCRVYAIDEDRGIRKELETTHSLFVYDVAKPTAVLQMLSDNTLEIRIPHIYFSTRQITGKIEAEIYTTMGESSIDLTLVGNVGLNRVSWKEANQVYVSREASKYTAPLSQLTYFNVYPMGKLVGGANEVDFQTLRERVINHGFHAETPITLNNIKNNAGINGYNLITSVDLLPDRIYHATRDLPKTSNTDFYSGASCAIETISTRMEDLTTSSTVIDNGDRMTITPKTLFRTQRGITRIVPDTEIPKHEVLGNDVYVQRINSLEYSYTPFYYVLDGEDNKFELRAYYVDSPMAKYQRLVRTNPTTQLTASISEYDVSRLDDGRFRVRVKTRGSDEYKEIHQDDLFMQIAFIPVGEEDYAYVNGEYVNEDKDGNKVWDFFLETNYDFDKKDNLIFSNFFMYTKEARKVKCPLETDFHIFLGAYDHHVQGQTSSTIDKMLGVFMLDRRREAVAITHNLLHLKLGLPLTHFWRNARVASSIEVFERYQADVVATYPETIFELDENNLPLFRAGEDGIERPVVKHRKGDIMVDEMGANIIKHRKGDVKKDERGNNILLKPREVARFLDIFLVDGIYRFATKQSDIEYARSIPETIVSMLENDIKPMTSRLLEETSLYFSPKKTMGTIKIITGAGAQRTILNRFPFRVDYYMTEAGYSNTELRSAITKMTKEVINSIVQNRTVSVESITRAMREKVNDEVIMIEVAKLGPDQSIQGYTVMDDDGRCAVKRKLKLRNDGYFEVVEDITVNFIDHERRDVGE